MRAAVDQDCSAVGSYFTEHAHEELEALQDGTEVEPGKVPRLLDRT